MKELATGKAFSYRELATQVRVLGDRLQQAGIEAGMVVGISLGNGVLYIRVVYALWRCGAVVVPIPPQDGEAATHSVINGLGLDVILSQQPLFPDSSPERLDRNLLLARFHHLNIERPDEFDTHTTAFMRFTSGTTGEAKGVVLKHETVIERIQCVGSGMGLSQEDAVLWFLPMSFHFTATITACLASGAGLIVAGETELHNLARIVRQHRPTVIMATPAQYALSCNGVATKLQGVRLAISTAYGLEHKQTESFFRHYGLALSQAYGLIEIGIPFLDIEPCRQSRGSVGKLVPGYELKLEGIGLDNRHRRIWLRGPGMLDAYYTPWKLQRDIMDNDWFLTGDLGFLDSQQRLFITGREKEVINVAGFKCFPGDIEAVLAEHPDVAESHVYSQPSQVAGEVPVAEVKLMEGANTDHMSLLRHCREHLPVYQVPISITLVDELTRNAAGKSQKMQSNNI